MKRVLIVDDNEVNLLLMQRRLARAGYETLTAPDGTSAIETVQAERPDLVLMDVSLPDIDGLEVTRRLRADPATAGVKVVALTAHAMPEDRARALDAGCDGYETKPVDLPRLLATARSLLGEAP